MQSLQRGCFCDPVQWFSVNISNMNNLRSAFLLFSWCTFMFGDGSLIVRNGVLFHSSSTHHEETLRALSSSIYARSMHT